MQKVLKSGKYAGGFVPRTKDEISKVKDLGINFITFSVDTNLIYNSVKTFVDSLDLNK